MYAVELVNLSKVFIAANNKEYHAVDRLNLQIKGGEFFSLLGSSGCGKTTTLRAIAGFETPTTGEIYIDGELMGKRPPFHRPVNTVFQNYALFPHLTIAENIAFGLEMEKLPKAQINHRIADVLAMVKLTGLEKRYPRQLSGGQQQRVALARSLVKRPKVLLLDEPLGALDLKLRKQMQLELKTLQQEVGITFIYVTHDQEEALTMSDRLAVMDKGKILQIGTPIEIYEDPNSTFVADFIGETNLLTARVVEQKGQQVVVLVDETLSLSLPTQEDLPVGKIVTLVIRPEKVIIDSTQDYPNSFSCSATIKEIVYIGTDTRYILNLTETSLLTIRQQNLHHNSVFNYQIGQQVKIHLPCDCIKLLLI